MTEQDRRAHQIVRKLFKNDYGEPFDMTDGQIELFRAIYERQYPRTQFECYTQYGKSDVVSMATLLRAATFPEKWIILGGTKDKAGIIMKKIIKHIFENDYTLAKFEISEDESIERIKREQSKERITFKVDEGTAFGEIVVLSADARRRSQDAGDILIGHGGQNLIEDDAALIPDVIHGKALRMLGGHNDNFLLKITNSLGRNHAYRSRIDPRFHNIVIDYNQGLTEGRITQEFVDEMRESLDPVMFDSLYGCIYPPPEMIEDGGWMPLITEEEIKEAQLRKVQPLGAKLLGCDISEGVNYNAFVIRQDNHARVKEKNQERDLMKTAENILNIRRDEYMESKNIFIDGMGVGAGVVSRCRQLKAEVNGVKTGEKPTERTEAQKLSDPIEFSNLRAEITWRAVQWIKHGGALEPHDGWKDLTKLRYRVGEGKRVQIMPKDVMRARGLLSPTESPDVGDAFCLTFAPNGVKTYSMRQTNPVLPYYPELGV